MNEFIEQFVIESREYVEQGTADLLALEQDPADAATLDSAFRAFHTLKGSAGIVEFAAMADAVHAAEDVLAAIRAGSRPITTTTISDCLACLDQVSRWLEAMQATGEVPGDAQAQAAAIVRRFGASEEPGTAAAPPQAHAANAASALWVEPLLAKHAHVRATATTAVRYAPDPDCFLEHEDPLARMAGLPGLLAVEVEPVTAWPPVDVLDPYLCNIVITALTRSSAAELSAAIGDQLPRCEVVPLVSVGSSPSHTALSTRAREVLEAQVALLRETGARHRRARAASAGAVAAHVLRSARHDEEAANIARLAQGDPDALLDGLEAILGQHEPMGEAAAHPAVDYAPARTLRVEASRIDALVNMTGELTVAKNSIGHIVKLTQKGDASAATMLKEAHARLDGLVGELQRFVLGMRVLPLRHVFQRFPRVLREMGAASGKPVELVVEGGETEADKTIVEMLFEPLLHVLRNAMDHGVEDAATRRARGKPPIARIVLRAQRAGDQVVVEVRDDGGGIDLARVRRVALARQLVEPDALAARSDAEIVDLIFEPGFSTADRVTDISGRGVGMDAVRTAVHRLGGRVTIESETGRGTTVRFALPFSVMMTRVMLVVAGGQTFGVPLDAVVETLRLDAGRVVRVGAAHAIVHRNRTVPVVALAQALGLPHDDRERADATLVVTAYGASVGALAVDAIGEQLEVMLKPLEGLLAGTRGLAGSALLGDGSVLLVIDLSGVLQ
jgi:two-component system chemotaxis sensor kinase CheA